MEKEIEKLNQEREKLLRELQNLEQKRNEIIIRLIEIQGILKYFQEKLNNQKVEAPKPK